MQKTAVFSVIAGIVFLFSGNSSGQISGPNSLKISGYGALEMGQINHGWYSTKELDHNWQEHFFGKISAEANPNERTSIRFGIEVHYQYSAISSPLFTPSFFPSVSVNLDRADLTYKLFEGAAPLSIQAGYFPFKYNSEARNLGEYLFRSGCYPTFVTNNFDFPLNRLMGFNFENSLFADNPSFSLKQNFLVTSEAENYPYGDVSLSYLVSATMFQKALTLGGGICGFRMFPVDMQAESPHNNSAFGTISEVNGTDTTFFTYAGTKLMVHAAFDPKVFFPSDIFGKEDLKLYGELAVLGLRNYPMYVDSVNFIGTDPDKAIHYDILRERMPFMLGFNIPTFKLLDVLSFEWEYWENRYLNDRVFQVLGNYGKRYPLPFVPLTDASHSLASNAQGKHKWSVYAKKQISNMEIVAQFGRDHRGIFVLAVPSVMDYADVTITAKDWYYLIKLGYNF
jgi:hypothetical protein